MRTALALVVLLAACPGKEKSGGTTPNNPGTGVQTNPGPPGKETLVEEGQSYPLGEGVSVTILSISMDHASDNMGNDTEYVEMQVRVDGPAGTQTLRLVSANPVEVEGYTLTASEMGFEWGASPGKATLTVKKK